jgi:hypothetical protein
MRSVIGDGGSLREARVERDERIERELPGVGDVGHALADRARDDPWGAVAVGLAVGYFLGGGLFTRATRWLVRAALAALLVPEVRARAVRAWRQVRPPATSFPPAPGSAPV